LGPLPLARAPRLLLLLLLPRFAAAALGDATPPTAHDERGAEVVAPPLPTLRLRLGLRRPSSTQRDALHCKRSPLLVFLHDRVPRLPGVSAAVGGGSAKAS
ncbi:unnamed protein product, partial [Ectocarpus sp. 12 AP-2014]